VRLLSILTHLNLSMKSPTNTSNVIFSLLNPSANNMTCHITGGVTNKILFDFLIILFY
jgi:hypothetical protein